MLIFALQIKKLMSRTNVTALNNYQTIKKS